jgi:hypothetical protein
VSQRACWVSPRESPKQATKNRHPTASVSQGEQPVSNHCDLLVPNLKFANRPDP